MGGKGSGRQSQYAKIPFAEGLRMFERQPGETDRAWHAFVQYRDMGHNRTLAAVAKSLGKSNTVVERWSVRWSWRVRIAEWDREADKRSREADFEALKEMRARQLQIATLMQGLGSLELQKLAGRAQKTGELVITADQARAIVIEGVKLERLNRNEPGEISEERQGPSLDQEQIEQRIEHLLKTRRK
jgi:hypothetical protein